MLALVACTADGGDPEDTSGDAPEDTSPEVVGDTVGDDTGDSGGGEPDEERAQYEAFYDLDVVQQVYLTISNEDQDLLRADPLTYVTATIEIDGTALDTVGLRIKGGGTWDAKPSLKVRLNEFVKDQRYGDLELLTFNNMNSDVSQAREVLGFAVLRAAEQLAPLANFAQVLIRADAKKEYVSAGLYANIESIDERFLRHRRIDDAGNLWEGNDSADFTGAGINHFELVWGVEDRTDLDDVREAVFAEDFLGDLGAVVDVAQFLEYWAWSLAVGSGDTYPYALNDYFLYDDPADGLFDFAPWELDDSWDTGLEWDQPVGLVGVKCTQHEVCTRELQEATVAAIELYEEADPAGIAQGLFDLSAEAVVDDAIRPWTVAEVEAARTALEYRVGVWPETLRVLIGL